MILWYKDNASINIHTIVVGVCVIYYTCLGIYESGGFGWSSLLLCDLTIDIKRGTIFFSDTLIVLKCLDTACISYNGNT